MNTLLTWTGSTSWRVEKRNYHPFATGAWYRIEVFPNGLFYVFAEHLNLQADTPQFSSLKEALQYVESLN